MPGEVEFDRSRQGGSCSQLPLRDGWLGRADGGGSSSSASSTSMSVTSFHSSPSAKATACGNYIEHRVSKMDTLAGVAIKYGVEVADIRRLNALVTDRQMFAHKSIKIPLPGRHPPSPIMTNGSPCNGKKPQKKQSEIDLLESFQLPITLRTPQRRVSPAMSNLQGYYGLVKTNPSAQETEMAVYGTGRIACSENEPLPRVSPISDPCGSSLSNSRNQVSEFSSVKVDAAQPASLGDENGEIDRQRSEKSIRRRQKVDVDSPSKAPELLSEEDATLSGRTVKGTAPRPKLGSRTDLDSSFLSATSTGGSSSIANGFLSVRKSSSMSDLQESDNGSSIWPTPRWPLKPDIIARPLFDGLPKPMTAWKSKAALD